MTLLSHEALTEFRDSLHEDSAWYVGSSADIDAWLKQLNEAIDSGAVDARPTWQIEQDEAAERVANLVVAKVMATLAAQPPQAVQVANDTAVAHDPEVAERLATTVVSTAAPTLAVRVAQPPGAADDGVAQDQGPLPGLVRAKDVGMSRREWRTAVRSGKLRASKIGREYKATRADYEAYLEAKRVEPSAPRQRKGKSDSASAAVERALTAGRLRALPGGRKR